MRARPAALVVAVMLGVAGCGVPNHTGVEVDGPAEDAGVPGDEQRGVPPGPDEAQNEHQLVDYFLQAAAGDPDNAVEQLRQFVHADERDDWQPDPQIMVIRVEDDPVFTPAGPAQHRVRLDARWIGTLSDGTIAPADGSMLPPVEFDVVQDPGSRDDVSVDAGDGALRIVDPPNVVLLSDEALAIDTNGSGYLMPSPVYFWDTDHQVLVPDLRWVPTALPLAQRAQAKLEWLTGGPSPWLDSLQPLPGEVVVEGNVVLSDDRLDITLHPAAADVEPAHLDAQVWWTLRTELTEDRPAWLTIDGHERSVASHESANPAARPSPGGYLVVDGEVVPYLPPDGSDVPRPEALAADVRAAALSRDGHAALVHLEDDGQYRLSLAQDADTMATGLVATEMSRPVWLSHPDGDALIAADGDLYRFSPDHEPSRVPVPGMTEEITALAVAPDGRRMAMVAADELYVASMVRRDDGSLGVNTPRRLPTSAGQLAGVTFLQEEWLAVVGQQDDGRSRLYELTIDGAYERELPNGDLGAPPTVTNVVGYPGDALSTISQRGDIMYEADGQVYRYGYRIRPRLVSLAELNLDPEAVSGEPRAPFYVE